MNVAPLMLCLNFRKHCGGGTGENFGYQHFLIFPQCFSDCFLMVVICQSVQERGKLMFGAEYIGLSKNMSAKEK